MAKTHVSPDTLSKLRAGSRQLSLLPGSQVQFITSGTYLGFRSDSIIQIYIRNDSDKYFEKECTISYLLNNTETGSNYKAETSIFNTQHPELPTGQLKLLRRDAQFFNIDLNEISWNNHAISQLPSGRYSIFVQLFIKDPFSPMNIVSSNEMVLDIK